MYSAMSKTQIGLKLFVRLANHKVIYNSIWHSHCICWGHRRIAKIFCFSSCRKRLKKAWGNFQTIWHIATGNPVSNESRQFNLPVLKSGDLLCRRIRAFCSSDFAPKDNFLLASSRVIHLQITSFPHLFVVLCLRFTQVSFDLACLSSVWLLQTLWIIGATTVGL